MALGRYRLSSILATTAWAAVRHIACEDVSDTHRAVTNSVILDCLYIGTTRACIVCCGGLLHLWLSDYCILLFLCKGAHTRYQKNDTNRVQVILYTSACACCLRPQTTHVFFTIVCNDLNVICYI